MESKWRYYNHAIIPNTAPHEVVDVSTLGLELKKNKKVLLARWTSEFDCGFETEWWWCIKDTRFKIEELDAKKRYCITRGKREFEVRLIEPAEFKEELYEVQVAAFLAYPKSYRPNVVKESFISELKTWHEYKVFGAFLRENGELCGYSLVKEHEGWAGINVQKTKPMYERLHVNAALVAKICEVYNEKFEEGFYIVDGERNISHETGFQGYLEKYFGFRKAYCRLNLIYRPFIKMVVKVLFPMKDILKRFDSNSLMHSVNAIMNLEEIYRTFVVAEEKR